jgi:hypothetical protein
MMSFVLQGDTYAANKRKPAKLAVIEDPLPTKQLTAGNNINNKQQPNRHPVDYGSIPRDDSRQQHHIHTDNDCKTPTDFCCSGCLRLFW